jgi:hypothetical protein
MTSIPSAEHGCPCVVLVGAVRNVARDRQLSSEVAEYFSRPGSSGSHRVARPDQDESRPSMDDDPHCSLMIQLTPEV